MSTHASRYGESLAWMLPLLAGAVWGLAAWLRRDRPPIEDLLPHDAAAPDVRLLEVDGHPVAYRDVGRGEPALLLLHCFAGRLEMWDSLQQRLAGTTRTVAFDLWGFGASGRPPTLRPQDWVRQVIGLMDRLGLAHAVLVGHSMGGRVALMCAVQAPARIRGLVLISADGLRLPQGYASLWALAHSPLIPLVQELLAHRPELLRHLLRESYPEDYPIDSALIRRYQRPLRVRGTAEAMRHLGQTYHGEDLARLAAQVAEVRCPALLLWGARDRVTPVREALHLVELLPSAELLILPHTHHLPHEEQPEVVAEHVRRFLGKVAA